MRRVEFPHEAMTSFSSERAHYRTRLWQLPAVGSGEGRESEKLP